MMGVKGTGSRMGRPNRDLLLGQSLNFPPAPQLPRGLNRLKHEKHQKTTLPRGPWPRPGPALLGPALLGPASVKSLGRRCPLTAPCFCEGRLRLECPSSAHLAFTRHFTLFKVSSSHKVSDFPFTYYAAADTPV